MADPDKGTDGTPIKPVSSLRSHFENMASSQPSSGVYSAHGALQPPSQLFHSQKDNHALEHTSLDIPRRLSPPFATANAVISDLHTATRMSNNSSLQSQGKSSSRRRRPTSMSSISSPRSSPVVSIDSPVSPPKSFALPKAPFASQASISNPPRLPGMKPRSPHQLPMPPPHSTDASSTTETRKCLLPARHVLHDLKSPADGTGIIRAHPTSSSAPPPIKRAEKPKIPNKPLERRSNPNIEPNLAIGYRKVSPYSTLPSTDVNPEPDSARSRRGYCDASRGEKGSYCQPAPGDSYVQRRNSGDVSGLNQHSSKLSDRQKSTNQPSSLPTDVQPFQPRLPPRQEGNKKLQQPSTPRPISMLNRTRTEQTVRQENVGMHIKPRIPSAHSIIPTDSKSSLLEFMPPPKRSQTSINTSNFSHETETRAQTQFVSQQVTPLVLDIDPPDNDSCSGSFSYSSYPDTSNINRRPPFSQQGVQTVETHYDTKLFDMSSRYICTTGYLTRAWDLISGDMVLNLGHDEKEIRVTALAFKPGSSTEDEGTQIWLGTNYGDIQEVDIPSQIVLFTKSAAHSRREIIKIFRYQNSMWTLDDDGRLNIWPASETGLPSLQCNPISRRISKGHNFSLIIQDALWVATRKDVRVFRPNAKEDAAFFVTKQALSQPSVGEITSGAVVAGQFHCVYFGHADGKVTAYSTTDFTCLGVFSVSVYRINCLVGAGSYLWAGYNSGAISIYDTASQPWTAIKEWQAHDHPVANILVDRSSIWKSGLLRVASIGTDNLVRLWDGMLEQDWLETDMQDHEADYCDFREIKAVVVTWNAGAVTPASLRYGQKEIKIFREVLHAEASPDLLVFGFQELVDLDDKKLTAKSFFKGNKKKDSSEQEHMSRQYRDWRDFLVRFIEDNMPPDEPYHLLHTASMVGLFSCVFVKASQRSHISNVSAAEIKRGLGGLHGNKGALVLRFILDNSSVCLINCHLAAGQTQTVHRNNDAAAILDSTILPPERGTSARCDNYVGGGDGSMILDHEICILNGDLNYRIDTMGRDTVIKAIRANNFSKLLERDQLLVSRRRNPTFRLRAFTESPILFAPTYKYDVGSDRYDTSEKHRAPAWCDRILYRGAGKIKQLEYRRHELQASDHRPVTASFVMRIKTVSFEKRARVWETCVERFDTFKQTDRKSVV